jgi:hypothetical protein
LARFQLETSLMNVAAAAVALVRVMLILQSPA